jgi:hypothetical protein
MTRYFFDLTDGTHERDNTGVELAGVEDATEEAIRFLGEVLKHEPERLAADSLRVDVSDDARTRLFTICATIEHA